ncbi:MULTISPECIES: helix-turn-helix domain-containing protein [unclassified Oceanispirochaeta]|nr:MULTISPECIES: helix-turn-helix domain-containing protein [unclassified Oceanispirochaeta]MBF9017624.1 helix-turn-helix domain-containing protein [Oceanispirochaeta sp. M2]NPD74196.1 helix-turn-helix domain-containing protein [Oceanispirochaeta sp. M1]
MKLMSNSLEIVIDNILDFSNLLAIDNIFNDYVRISDKKYFEQFSDISFNYSDQDYRRLYEYLNIRGEIYDTLETMTLSNEFIESIYFLDSSRNIVFKNGRLPQSFESFPDKAWYKVVKNSELLPYIMSIRTIENEDQSQKNIISIISENIEEDIPFIINVDAEILYRKIISNVGWDPDNIFFILSKEGKPLLYSSKDSQIINKISILAENNTASKSESLLIDDREFLISSLKIDPLGWTVYSATDAKNLNRVLSPYRIRIFILSMLFFPLSLLLAYYLSQKLYKPIRNLSTYVRTLNQDDETNTASENEDLGLIWETLKTSELREKKLEEKFRESLPAYRKDFLKRLLSSHSYDISDILDRLKYIDSPLSAENLAVIIIQPDNSDSRSLSISDRVILGLEIEQILQDTFFQTFFGEYLSISSSEYCIIFNLPHSDLKSSSIEIEDLINSLTSQMSMQFTFGIGSPARTVFELNKSYSEAIDAIRLRSLADTGHAIFYEDLKIGETEITTYDFGTKISLLKDCIKRGNSEESVHFMNEIYHDLTNLKNTLSYRRAKQIYITALNEIYNAINDLGLDSDELIAKENPFGELLSLGTITDINNWMITLLKDVTGKIKNLSEEKKNKKIETIIAYIDKECGQDINLNIIADKINLNPSYISRLFKEHMKLSFIDYLTDVRIKKAMRLLKETDLKIQEIGSEVGYFNSNYFIRLFKKKTGRTPGEYRQLLK